MTKKTIKKKINLLGDAAVGKTSLTLRYAKGVFGDEYLKTVGTNVYSKTIEFENKKVRLIIYDIMGDKGYDAVQEGAFQGSQGAIGVVDMTRPETLKSLVNNWIPKYRKFSNEENPILPVVNKYDLRDKKPEDQMIKGVPSNFERIVFTSAKTGRNVDYIFKKIAAEASSENYRVSPYDLKSIISNKNLDSPHELLDALLAISSELGDMGSLSREWLLEESSIVKFDLEEDLFEIEEEDVLTFAEKLATWYEKNDKKDAKDIVDRITSKYKSGQ